METFDKFWYLLPKKDADVYFVSAAIDKTCSFVHEVDYVLSLFTVFFLFFFHVIQ